MHIYYKGIIMALLVTLRSVCLLSLVETSFICLHYRKVGRKMQGNRFVSEGHGCHVPAKMEKGRGGAWCPCSLVSLSCLRSVQQALAWYISCPRTWSALSKLIKLRFSSWTWDQGASLGSALVPVHEAHPEQPDNTQDMGSTQLGLDQGINGLQ